MWKFILISFFVGVIVGSFSNALVIRLMLP